MPSLDGKTEWKGDVKTTGEDIFFIRKKEPHRLYAVNRFYRVKAPYLEDADDRRVDLTYTMKNVEGKLLLTLDIPPILGELEYPVVVDPSVYLDTSHDGFEWINEDDCNTYDSWCDNYESENNMQFRIPNDCSTDGQVSKPTFRFDTNGLDDEHYGDVVAADLHIEGTCGGQSSLDPDEWVLLYEVTEFEGTPACEGENAPDKVGVSIATLMSDYYCAGTKEKDITDEFTTAVENEQNISFQIDLDPSRNSTYEPTYDIKYDISDSNLYIEYWFDCEVYDDCADPSEFCWDDSGGLCQDDLQYGESCEDIATDNDNYACQNNNCELDDFDGLGAYCTEDNKCTHDGTQYTTGQIHCNQTTGNSYWKNCTGTNWSTQTNCTYGCTENTGCATTTTTTTTSTTTTTTLEGDISVSKNQITITVIK
ncbi:MAG: hypothetical protein GF416_04390 [Candidatus Altiarchaeales archaeon]|nr:hypothetical protein [Candidatus Altiarchaeales archaeon]